MKRHPVAFTLVEMLVVIAILTILAALLFPVLGRGRDEAKATVCRNNLSQIGKALAAYTGDFAKYPGTRSTPIHFPPQSADDWAQVWDYRLVRHVGVSRDIFGCPSDLPPHSGVAFSLTNYSYGYNAYGSGRLPGESNLGLGHAQVPETPEATILEVKESQIRVPAEMIAVGDLVDHPQVFTTTITPSSLAPYAGAAAARHSGGANMLFCDGHIQFARQRKWNELGESARRLWNSDHQPHPEGWR